MSELEEKMKDLAKQDWECLIVAGIVGEAELALEFERLELSSEHDSLQDARELRPYVMAGIAAARKIDEP